MIKNKYLGMYFSFLILELPNFIQIFGLPTLLGILLKSKIATALTSGFIGSILGLYLMEKSHLYLYEQIKDPLSKLNREKLPLENVLKKWTTYIIATSLLLGVSAAMIIQLIKDGLGS